MTDNRKPERIAIAPRPDEPAAQYQLSIEIVVTQPGVDEKRVRKVCEEEFRKLWNHLNKQ